MQAKKNFIYICRGLGGGNFVFATREKKKGKQNEKIQSHLKKEEEKAPLFLS